MFMRGKFPSVDYKLLHDDMGADIETRKQILSALCI